MGVPSFINEKYALVSYGSLPKGCVSDGENVPFLHQYIKGKQICAFTCSWEIEKRQAELSKMEAILHKLVMPDNEAIKQGTLELKEAFKQPNAVPQLCEVLSSSKTPQIRQYSALLLRKKLGKKKLWSSLNPSDRETLKNGTMEALTREPEKTVQHAIVQLIAVLAKHELLKNQWPELIPLLEQCFQSEEPGRKSLAMFMASALCESSAEVIKNNYFAGFCKLFNKSLTSCNDPEVGYHASLAMGHLVPFIGSEELKFFQPLVGNVTTFIKKLIDAGEEEKAATAMEIYDDLFESEVAIVVPHIKPIVELCMVVAANPNCQDSLRVKAISFLGTLTRMKKKTIVKHKLYIQMVNVLFPILCTFKEGEENGEEEDDEDDLEDSPTLCAAQTLDLLALNLPPEKYMSALMSHLNPALNSSDPKLLKGAFEALAVSAEGCSDHIRKKYLVNFLKYLDSGIRHPMAAVRNAALYALGQFSEYMQPEISNYANQILPVLIQYLDSACQQMQQNPAKKAPGGLDRVFYALQIFCENMEKKLVPFLPELMTRLLPMASPSQAFPITVKQLAISGIGSVANAVKGAMVTFFADTIEPLKGYLQPQSNDEGITLLSQSMDTLSSLARAVGPTNFVPSLAEECCKLGIELMNQHDDPDVRKAAFNLFGAVAFVAKANMGSILPGLVEQMLNAAVSKDGISLELKDDDIAGLPLDELSDDEDDENTVISLDADSSLNDLENIKSINVENAYKDEKETAIAMLKEMCESCGPKTFLPFVPKCLEEIWPQLEHVHEDIRRESVYAVSKFCAAYYIELDQGVGDLNLFNQTAEKLVPLLCQMVRTDESIDVVCACLDMVADLLKSCKQGITNLPGLCEEIIQVMHNVIQSKCACMDSDQINENDDDVSEEAEQDEVLFEYAGDILPSLGMALGDPVKFQPYFAGMLGHLLKKTKPKCTTAEKSFAAGSMAECMEPLQGQLEPFVSHIMPVFLKLVEDEDDDVRNNAVFGLGELVFYSGSVMHQHFGNLLATLSNLMSNEKAPRVIDQIVGAVCRLIMANKDLVPVDAVVPVILQQLPLREDYDEYETVFKTLIVLLTNGHPAVVNATPQIIAYSLELFGTDEEFSKEKVLPPVKATLRQMQASFPEPFQAACATLSPEQKQALLVNMNE